MGKLTSSYEINLLVTSVGNLTIVKRTRLGDNVHTMRCKFDVFYEVYSTLWVGASTKRVRSPYGHMVARCRSEAEALHYCDGVLGNRFVPIPVASEFDYDPGLEAFVEQGA